MVCEFDIVMYELLCSANLSVILWFSFLVVSGAIGFVDLAKRISESWKNLDEESRASFQTEADKLKEQYQLQLRPKKKSHSTNKQHISPLFIHDPRNPEKVADNTDPGEDEKHNKKGQGITQNIDEGPLRQAFSQYESTRHAFNGYVGNYHPSSSLNEDADSGGSIQQKRFTAPHAFLPPFPHQQYEYIEDVDQPVPVLHKPPPREEDSDDSSSDEELELEPANEQKQQQQQHEEEIDYAYQCEICSSAVFATYQECADHEEQCTGEHESMKKFGSASAIQIKKANVEEQPI